MKKRSDKIKNLIQLKSNQTKSSQGKTIQPKPTQFKAEQNNTRQNKIKQINTNPIKMVNFNEEKIRMKYEKLGYKVLRGGCPDFLIFKYDKKNKIFLDVQFVEVKYGGDRLSYEQEIYRKVLKSLGLNYKLDYIPSSKEAQTKQIKTTQSKASQIKPIQIKPSQFKTIPIN